MVGEYADRALSDIYAEIQERYRADSWPWILGYSGGKDSTVLVQLVWSALAQLPKKDFLSLFTYSPRIPS